MGTLNDLLRERNALRAEREELRAAIREIAEALEGGDLSGAVNDATALLPAGDGSNDLP